MRSRWFGVLGVVVGSVAMMAGAEAGEDEGVGKHPIPIMASPAILPKGASCRILLKPEVDGPTETVTMTYEGTVVKADDTGLSLEVVSQEEVRVHRSHVASRLPYFSRFFTNVGLDRETPKEKTEVWIAVETIKSVTLVPHADLEKVKAKKAR